MAHGAGCRHRFTSWRIETCALPFFPAAAPGAFSILLPATGLSSQGSAALSNVSSRSTHTNIPSAMVMPRTSMRVTYLQSILIAGSAFKCHASAIMQLKFVAEALFAP